MGETPKPSKPEASNGDALVQPELPEFKGGVNSVEAAVNEIPEFKDGVNAVEAAVNEIPEFKDGVNAVEAAVNEIPEFKGGVNSVEATVNEVPAFDLAKLGTAQPSTPGVDFGQKAPEVKEPAKVEAKNEKSLPNTGMNTSSTTALGLSLIGLIGLVVRRKLSK